MRTTARGFTLVEVLVAVSLLSVLMLALASAFRTMAQTESRVDERAARTDDQRVAADLLRQVLGRVSARRITAPGVEGGFAVPFQALPQAIEWAGILPARPGVGGRTWFRLQVEPGPAGDALVLRFAPWDPAQPTPPDPSQAESRVLVPTQASLQVFAEGQPPAGAPLATWPQGWVEGWPPRGHLPERLRLRIADAHGPWPDVVIPVHGMSQGSNTGDGFTIGGSR